jgi:hypothetical protein
VTITATNRTIEAVDTNGFFFGGQLSQLIDGIPSTPAPAITSMTTNSMALSWDSVPRATKYKIIRSDGSEIETLATSYTDLQWTPSSGYTYVIEAINRSGHSTNHPTLAAAPKHVWALSNNLPWNADMSVDIDGDGIANMLEYFHGLNPTKADGPVPVALEGISGHWIQARYWRNPVATDATSRVLWTTNLASGPWSDHGVTTEPLGGNFQGWYRVSVPIDPNAAQKFLRLEVKE